MNSFEKQKIRWEKQKAKGKTKYVLFYVFLWVIYAVVLATMSILTFHRAYLNHINEIITTYIFYIIFLGLAGIVNGNISWWANVKKYKY